MSLPLNRFFKIVVAKVILVGHFLKPLVKKRVNGQFHFSKLFANNYIHRLHVVARI